MNKATLNEPCDYRYATRILATSGRNLRERLSMHTRWTELRHNTLDFHHPTISGIAETSEDPLQGSDRVSTATAIPSATCLPRQRCLDRDARTESEARISVLVPVRDSNTFFFSLSLSPLVPPSPRESDSRLLDQFSISAHSHGTGEGC